MNLGRRITFRPRSVLFRCSGTNAPNYANLDLLLKEDAVYKDFMSSTNANDVMKEFIMRSPSFYAHSGNSGFREYLLDQGLDAAADLNAFKMFSSICTFPLTLAFALNALFSANVAPETVSTLVVGARGESSLPPIWWRELLVVFDRAEHGVRIGMVGPHLQSSPLLTTAPTAAKWPLYKPSKSVEVFHVHDGKCKLHDHPKCVELLRESDVTVLFNPGFGSSTLKESWRPTLSLLLQARKPVVCTAHSRTDLERDLKALVDLSDEEDSQDFGESVEFLLPPTENPFRSLRVTADPKEEEGARAVTCNEFVYIFIAK